MSRDLLFVHSSGPQGEHEGSHDMVNHLRAALGAEYRVRYPIMPGGDATTYARWAARLDDELDAERGEQLLVGHSFGASVLLKWLCQRSPPFRIASLHLVATPFWAAEGEVAEFALPEDFAARLPPIPKIFVYHSRDDEEVPFAHLARYARELPRATVRALDGYGHLFVKPFPELVRDISGLASER